MSLLVSFVSCFRFEDSHANLSILMKRSPKALLLHLKRFAIVAKPRIQTSLSVEKEGDSNDTVEATERPPAVEMTFRKNKVSFEVDFSRY